MNRFLNGHLHGCEHDYIDHLLDEKIMNLKRQIMEHLNDKSVHVTDEEKEKWNEKECSSSGSSDSSDDATSSTVIPTKISELENDVNFLTADDMSVYATEEEVRSWLDGYQKKDGVSSDGGSSSDGEFDEDDEFVDDAIIDKFSINPQKISLAGVKSIGLYYKDGRLSIKPFTAQVASLSVTPASIEYGTSANVTLTASYKPEEMQQVVVSGGNIGVKNITDVLTDAIVNATNPVVYTLKYTPKEDVAGTTLATVNIAKRYYTWYSSNNNEMSIPQTSVSKLLTQKPSLIEANVPSGKYVYFAFPTSWGVNTSQFKVQGFNFAHLTIGTCNGPYNMHNDYVVIRSAEKGLGQLIINT